MSFASTWMDLQMIILSEVSQTEKDKYHMISLICGIHFFKWYKWTYLQNRNRLIDIKNKLMVTKGETLGGRDKSGAWDKYPHTTICNIDNQQVLTV